MIGEKSIIIGCDDTSTLSVVLSRMKEINPFTHHIISAARISDLLDIARSLAPDLIILCFRNNQLALNDYNSFVKKPGIPLLCLTRAYEHELLRWGDNNIVFTYPLDHIHDEQYLSSRIHSIFLLRADSSYPSTTGSFVSGPTRKDSLSPKQDLSRYVLELDQKVEVLSRIKDRIADLYPQVDDPTRVELTSIVHSIKASANDNKLWDDFKLYFEQTNPHFLLLLAKKHPDLTPKDLKYCCYLKMNMTNDDIRNLLGINQESVRTHKYRLKKKMLLSKDDDLRGYLLSICQLETHFA